MNYIYIKIRTLNTRCLKVRVNVGIKITVYIFKVHCSIRAYEKVNKIKFKENMEETVMVSNLCL
jgi:hypothetical protein